jgi:hypothetical protein
MAVSFISGENRSTRRKPPTSFMCVLLTSLMCIRLLTSLMCVHLTSLMCIRLLTCLMCVFDFVDVCSSSDFIDVYSSSDLVDVCF